MRLQPHAVHCGRLTGRRTSEFGAGVGPDGLVAAFDDDDRLAGVCEAVEESEELFDVGEVQDRLTRRDHEAASQTRRG